MLRNRIGVGSAFGSWYPEGKGPLLQEPSTFASGSNIFPCRGKSPPVVQSKRRHPQDGNHARSNRGGGLANCPRVLQWKCEINVDNHVPI
jgi:hypothetical protein